MMMMVYFFYLVDCFSSNHGKAISNSNRPKTEISLKLIEINHEIADIIQTFARHYWLGLPLNITQVMSD